MLSLTASLSLNMTRLNEHAQSAALRQNNNAVKNYPLAICGWIKG
jgi:hypothetical protein